jgi:NADP-dependent 3-hydroxy acid dehydrogenase YdfG
MIDINVKGLLYVSKAIIPKMKENQVISSILVPLPQKKCIQTEMYCATKHAVDA